MFNEKYQGFESFSLTHLIAILVCVTVAVLIIVFRKKFQSRLAHNVFRFTMAGLLFTFELTFHIWTAVSGNYWFDIIPLELCAICNIATIIALVFDLNKVFEIIYTWAICGAMFSLIFVEQPYLPPHFRFFHYFLIHFGFMLANIYYVATGRAKLTRKKLNLSMAILFSASCLVWMIDVISGMNFMFFLQSPIKEISDVLGSPLYPLLWIATIAALMNIIYYVTKLFCLRCRIFQV